MKHVLDQQKNIDNENIKQIRSLNIKLKVKDEALKSISADLENTKKELAEERYKHNDTKSRLQASLENKKFLLDFSDSDSDNPNVEADAKRMKDSRLHIRERSTNLYLHDVYRDDPNPSQAGEFKSVTFGAMKPIKSMAQSRKILKSESSLSPRLKNLSLRATPPLIVPKSSPFKETEFKSFDSKSGCQLSSKLEFVALDDDKTTKLKPDIGKHKYK